MIAQVDTVQLIRSNYQRVLDLIAASARRVGRDPASVRLVVVSKGHSLEAVQAAVAAGVAVFGENYAEEGVAKIQALAGAAPLEWHMIGHVQSRKASLVCQNFDYVHSLDSLKLALRLDRFAAEARRMLPVLLECNLSGEESKFGWSAWDASLWVNLRQDLSRILELPNLSVRGLMTMPPFFEDPELSRPYFQRLCQLRDDLAASFPGLVLPELSMGMSADYPIAVQEGATFVRVGTAIMGARPACQISLEVG